MLFLELLESPVYQSSTCFTLIPCSSSSLNPDRKSLWNPLTLHPGVNMDHALWYVFSTTSAKQGRSVSYTTLPGFLWDQMICLIMLWGWFELRKFNVIWESGLERTSRPHQRKDSKFWLPLRLDEVFRNHSSSYQHCRNYLVHLWQGPRSLLCPLQGTSRNTCNVLHLCEKALELWPLRHARSQGHWWHLPSGQSTTLLFY